MTQRESKLSAKIQTALRQEGVFCFKVHGSALMMAGLPDIIACVDGRFVGIEVKLPETRNNLSARQKYVHSEIDQAEGEAWVVCSVQETLDHLQMFRLALHHEQED